MDERSWKMLRTLLESDHRKDGSQGRALQNNISKLKLQKGDRVEPEIPGVWDWQVVDKGNPGSLLMWRPKSESFTKHRNPMFSENLGSSIWQCVAVDGMHTWALGIFQQFISRCLWNCLDGNVMGCTYTSQLKKMELRMEVLGKRKKTEFLAKAAETVGVLHFLGGFLAGLTTSTNWHLVWKDGADALLKLWSTCQDSAFIMTQETQEVLGNKTDSIL